MTSEQLQRVESELGLSLPLEYREAMLVYALDPEIMEDDLIDDPDRILEDNEHCRKNGFFDLPWPGHYFTFGGDGAGNIYILDLSVTPPTVLFGDHEVPEYRLVNADFSEWVKEMHIVQAEIQNERNDERKAHEEYLEWRRRRKDEKLWWQFWK